MYLLLYTPEYSYTNPKPVTGLGALVKAANGVPAHSNTCYAAAGVHLLRGAGILPLQEENKPDYEYWKEYIVGEAGQTIDLSSE